MKLNEVQAFAKNFRPSRRSFIFVTPRDFEDLMHDMRENHPHLIRNPGARPTRVMVDQLVVVNAQTYDRAVLREANRLAQREYQVPNVAA